MFETQDNIRQFGRCHFDTENKFLWHNGDPVDLPPKALELLCLLVESDGSVVSKATIWKSVWKDAHVEETNLTHNIYLLRKKFKEMGEGDPIQTVPRRGYRFTRAVNEGGVIIERHAFRQTVIDEVDANDSTSVADKGHGFAWPYRMAVLGLLALVVAVLGLGVLRGSKVAVSTPDRKIESVAVLPFLVLNGAAANSHEGVGMTDVLVTRLSSVKQLRVRPASTTLAFAGKDPVESGKLLGVDSVLEGTLYRQNDSLRVTARLIRLSDETVLWAGQFERTSKDELRVQNEIAEQVVSILAGSLGSNESYALAKSYTESINAWHLYTKARVEWNKRTWASMLDAQRLFRNAIDVDPDFALAYAGLADTLATGGGVDEANILVEMALELDPLLAEAHASQGFIRMFHGWDWDGAESSFRRSIELNANYATAHHWYATLLSIRGRNEEAKAEMQRALEINPSSPNFLADLGQIYYFNKEYEQAKELCNRALALDPEFLFAHEYLHDIYLKTAEYDKAVESELAAQRINSALQGTSSTRRQQMADERDLQRKLFHEKGIAAFEANLAGKAADSPWGYLAATRFAFLGDTEQTIRNLERSVKDRGFLTPYIKADPVFESVSSHPRYNDLLARMALQ